MTLESDGGVGIAVLDTLFMVAIQWLYTTDTMSWGLGEFDTESRLSNLTTYTLEMKKLMFPWKLNINTWHDVLIRFLNYLI